MRIAILGDTHFPRRGGGVFPPACVAECLAADLVVHTGDVADMAGLRALGAMGRPVVAVHGNADDTEVRAELPAVAEVELPGGRRLGLVHIGGPEKGRLARMRKRFPDCTAVAFGHSHIPLLARADDGFMILNPGSATDRRRQPRHSMAVLTASPRGDLTVRFVDLDAGGADLDAELVRSAA
jgi:putative phosphoesterase